MVKHFRILIEIDFFSGKLSKKGPVCTAIKQNEMLSFPGGLFTILQCPFVSTAFPSGLYYVVT
jgi:hypothetical protein